MKLKTKKELYVIEDILSKLNIENNVSDQIYTYISNHFSMVEKTAQEAYNGEIPAFKLCRRKPFTRLAVVCFKLIDLKQRYLEKGIPDQIFVDTIQDVKLRQELYFQKTGTIGLDREAVIWFRHLFNMHIFKLNGLQFQLFHMVYLDGQTIGEEYMTFSQEQKEKLPEGTPVINVHVQCFADISPAVCDQSFSAAFDFFHKFFPEHKFKAFICYSWLLFSGNQSLMGKQSNILKFAQRFEIISEVNDNEQAIYNIYGKRYRRRADYPVKTSLQKNALKKLSHLGYGCGVIYLSE